MIGHRHRYSSPCSSAPSGPFLCNPSSQRLGVPSSSLTKPTEALQANSSSEGATVQMKGSAITFRQPAGSYLGYWRKGALLSPSQFQGSPCGATEHELRNGRKAAALLLISLAERRLEKADFWAVNQKLMKLFQYLVVFPRANTSHLHLLCEEQWGQKVPKTPLHIRVLTPTSKALFCKHLYLKILMNIKGKQISYCYRKRENCQLLQVLHCSRN